MKDIVAWGTRALASCFFLSYLPVQWRKGHRLTGAGLVGTLFGLATVVFLPVEAKPALAVLLGGVAIAVAVSDYAEQLMGQKDDPRIVIDEWIGYRITVAFLPRTALILILGFVFFRLFDVLKLPSIQRAGHWPGGWGVVMDDVLAGILANLCLQVVRHVF